MLFIGLQVINLEPCVLHVLFHVCPRSHPLIKQFGLTLQSRPVDVSARVLQPPSAAFDRSRVIPLKPGSWTSPGFYDPAGHGVELLWAILCVPPDRVR